MIDTDYEIDARREQAYFHVSAGRSYMSQCRMAQIVANAENLRRLSTQHSQPPAAEPYEEFSMEAADHIPTNVEMSDAIRNSIRRNG